MKINDYQNAALATAVYPENFNIIYPALGMNGESGEVAEKVKKLIRDTELEYAENGSILIPDEKRMELAKEIGDVLWYCATLSHDIGFTLEEIANINIDKLRSRFLRNKISGSGDNR